MLYLKKGILFICFSYNILKDWIKDDKKYSLMAHEHMFAASVTGLISFILLLQQHSFMLQFTCTKPTPLSIDHIYTQLHRVRNWHD